MTCPPDSVAAGGEAVAAPPAGFPFVVAWVGLLSLSAAAATAGLWVWGTGQGGLFLPAVCVAMLVLAAGFDSATEHIPNPITYTGLLVGVILNSSAWLVGETSLGRHWLGAVGPTQALAGLAVFGGIGLVSWLVAGMGGGDTKLLAAVGAMLGLSRGADALICGLAVAVVYSLVNLAIAGRLNAVARGAGVAMLNLLLARKWSPWVMADPLSARRIPVALPVLVGMLLSESPPVGAMLAWVRG